MQRLILVWVILIGPCYVACLVGLMLGRRFCPEAQALYELTESIVFYAAAVMALALAGMIVQLL